MGSNGKHAAERYAVVTGANKGIDLETVRQLASQGVTVVLTDQNEKRGMEALLKLQELGLSNIVFHQLDVLDPVSIKSLANFIQEKFGKLDILVNNAGASGVVVDEEGLKALNIDPSSWRSGQAYKLIELHGVIKTNYEKAEECLNTNYHGVRRVTEALLPLLQLSLAGARIVNVSSLRSELKVNNAGASAVVVDMEGLKALNIDPSSRFSDQADNLVQLQAVVKTTYEKAEECLNTNYYGVRRVTEALLPLLQLSPAGARMVNLSSRWSQLKRIPGEHIRKELSDVETLTEERVKVVIRRFLHDLKENALEGNVWPLTVPAYGMSKVTLNAYTRILAKKFTNMCINCVHPGYVKTDINWNTGTMSVEEGARGPVMLALLPDGGPTGCHFDRTEVAEF